MSEKITAEEFNDRSRPQREKAVLLRDVILYLHTNQIIIREGMEDHNIVSKIVARLYHDRLVGINEAVYDPTLDMAQRVQVYMSPEHDIAYGKAMAFRYGLTLTSEQAVAYDVTKYRGDMTIHLNEKEMVDFARYLYSLGAVSNSPKILPATDGINHINIYSRGKSSVGRIASNFYSDGTMYNTDHGQFLTLEGYYHWLRVAEYHVDFCGLDIAYMESVYPETTRLRFVDGEEAIRLGRKCKSQAYAKTKFRPGALTPGLFLSFARAMVGKLFRPYDGEVLLGEYLSDLLTSKFTLVHYYNMSNGVVYPKHGEWLPELITGICSHIDPAGGSTTVEEILYKLPEIIGE